MSAPGGVPGPGGVCLLPAGGVPGPGGCLLPGGCVPSWGVWVPGPGEGYLHGGGVPGPGGLSAPGGCLHVLFLSEMFGF